MQPESSPKRAGEDLENSARKRSKVTRACDACRSRKKRCSGNIPCLTCVKNRHTCTYEQEYLRGAPRDPSPAIAQPVESRIPPRALDLNISPRASGDLVHHLRELTRDDSHLDVSGQGTASEPPSRRLSPEPGAVTHGNGQYRGPTSALSFLGRAWKRLDLSGDPDPSNTIFSAGDRRIPTPDTTAFSWPKPSCARELVRRYFDFAAPTYRVLHETTISGWVSRLHDPQAAPLSVAAEAILLMVFATASMYQIPLIDADAQAWQHSEQYCVLAEQRMSSETGFPTLESVQSRFLLVLYLMSSSRPNKAWFTHGTVVQLIMTLGLHRRRKSMKQPAPSDLIIFECRKRVLWCSYTLDQYLSIILGRPRLLRDGDIDQDFPTRIDDEDLNRQVVKPGLGKDCTIDASIFHARLARILAKANREQYTLANLTDDHQLNLSVSACEDIKSWQESLPPFLSGVIQAGSLIPVFRRQLTVLRLAYFHATMFVTRSLLLPSSKAAHSMIQNPKYHFQLRTCVSSAQNALRLVLAFVEEGQFYPAFWYSQYIAFNALTIVYIYLYQVKQKRISSELIRDVDGDEGSDQSLFSLAQACQRHLAETTARNAPAYKYSTILAGLGESLDHSLTGQHGFTTMLPSNCGMTSQMTDNLGHDAAHINPVLQVERASPGRRIHTYGGDFGSQVNIPTDHGPALNHTSDPFQSTTDTGGLFQDYGDDFFGTDIGTDFWSTLDSLPLSFRDFSADGEFD